MTLKHFRLPALIVFGALLTLLVLTVLVLAFVTSTQRMAPGLGTVSVESEPTLDPLTIAAMRAGNYPGSAIVTERELGDKAGYSDKIVSFTSDGLKEFALVSTPTATPPAGGWPVIILNHGYINPAEYQTTGTEYQTLIAALARAGYVVIKPDYRGHGQSQGVAEGGHFSPAYAYDVLNLITSLKSYPSVNPKRIGLLGHSLGGHVSLRTIVVSPDVKASVFMSGVVGSIDDILYHWPHSPMPNDRPAVVQQTREALLQKYGTPLVNPDFWNNASAVNFVRYVTGPVQVNHSTGDSTVPFAFSEHLVTALQQAGKAVEFNSYPGNDHQLSANYPALLQNLLAFFSAKL